jgi:hypothetical protein
MYFQLSDHIARAALRQAEEVSLAAGDGECDDMGGPPSYALGMVEHKLEKAPGIYDPVVQISLHRRHSRPYDTGDMVSGNATITPRKDTPFGAIVISLVMQEIIHHDGRFASLQFSQSKLLARHVVPLEVYPEDMVLRAGNRYTLPFLFVIPDKIHTDICACSSEYGIIHQELLPSHGLSHNTLGEAGDGLCDEPGQVVYQIETKVLQQSSSDIAEIGRRRIPVRPTTVQPSSVYTDGPHSVTRPLLSGLMRKTRIGDLTTTVNETVHVSVQRPATAVEVMLRYIPVNKAGGLEPPPRIKTVTYGVDAITFTSQTPLGSSFQLNTASRADLTEKRYKLVRQKLTVDKPTWKILEDGSMQTVLKLPFVLPPQDKVIQSYVGCITGRQYEFNASFSFVGGVSPVSVAVPTIVSNYRQRAASIISLDAPPSLLSESFEEAPKYDEIAELVSETSSLRTLEYPSFPVRRLPTPGQ